MERLSDHSWLLLVLRSSGSNLRSPTSSPNLWLSLAILQETLHSATYLKTPSWSNSHNHNWELEHRWGKRTCFFTFTDVKNALIITFDASIHFSLHPAIALDQDAVVLWPFLLGTKTHPKPRMGNLPSSGWEPWSQTWWHACWGLLLEDTNRTTSAERKDETPGLGRLLQQR